MKKLAKKLTAHQETLATVDKTPRDEKVAGINNGDIDTLQTSLATCVLKTSRNKSVSLHDPE